MKIRKRLDEDTSQEYQSGVHQTTDQRLAELEVEGVWPKVTMWDWSDHWLRTTWRTPTLEELK